MAPALARQGRGPRRALARRVRAARRWGGSLTRSRTPHGRSEQARTAHGTRTRHTHTAHAHTHTHVARTKETGTRPSDLTHNTHTQCRPRYLGEGRVGLVVTRSPFDVGLHTQSVSSAQRRVRSTAYRHAHAKRPRLLLVVNGNFGRLRFRA